MQEIDDIRKKSKEYAERISLILGKKITDIEFSKNSLHEESLRLNRLLSLVGGSG